MKYRSEERPLKTVPEQALWGFIPAEMFQISVITV